MHASFVFIKKEYFIRHSNFIEMLDPNDHEKQSKRQYVFLRMQYKENTILLPLRSKLPELRGKVGFKVPSESRPDAGIDYRKMLFVNKEEDIEIPSEQRIANAQKKIIEENYLVIQNEVIQYVDGYIRCKRKGREEKDYRYKFSTLHNFHRELGIENP